MLRKGKMSDETRSRAIRILKHIIAGDNWLQAGMKEDVSAHHAQRTAVEICRAVLYGDNHPADEFILLRRFSIFDIQRNSSLWDEKLEAYLKNVSARNTDKSLEKSNVNKE